MDFFSNMSHSNDRLMLAVTHTQFFKEKTEIPKHMAYWTHVHAFLLQNEPHL